MALLKKTRASQDVQAIQFNFGYADTMVNKAGVLVDFGVATTGPANVFEIATLPKGARVVGGSFERTEVFDTAAYTVFIGDSGDTDRYLASADLKAAGLADLLKLVGTGTQTNVVEMSVANTDVCTTGKGRVTILFTIDDRAVEVTGKM
jgi:hypothetical protein